MCMTIIIISKDKYLFATNLLFQPAVLPSQQAQLASNSLFLLVPCQCSTQLQLNHNSTQDLISYYLRSNNM